MTDSQKLLAEDEKIYWQGSPEVSWLTWQAIICYIIPGVILLLFWGGWIEYGKDSVLSSFLHQNTMVHGVSLLLIIGVIVSPVIRWYFYTKRLAYIFTDKRAIAYYKGTGEIAFQIEAGEIPAMQRTNRGGELVSLHKYIEEEDAEAQGIKGVMNVSRAVRVGFEGIPARLLDLY